MSRRSGGFRRAMPLIVGLSFLSSCTGWQAIAVPEPTTAPRLPATVRITLTSHRQWQLAKPHFKGDSLIGMDRLSYTHPRLAFPRSAILLLEDSRPNTGNTGLLVVGILLGSLVVVGAVVASNFCVLACG